MAVPTVPPVDEDPLLAAVDAADRGVAAAAVAVTWQVADEAVLAAVQRVARLRARVDALHLDLVRQVDRRGVATASPVATTPEGFLRTACLVDAGQARRDVAAARATAPGQPLAPFGEALARGGTSRAHVDVAVACLDAVPRHVLTRPGAGERMAAFLQEAAAGAGPTVMRRSARQLLARLAPDREDRFDAHAHQRRFLDVHTDDTGMVVGTFQLDAVTGVTFRTALDRHSAPTVGADGDPDRRTPRQRRADALGLVCETALGVAVPRRGERPRVVVHTTVAQLARGASMTRAARPGDAPVGLAHLDDGEPLSPAETARLACDAVLQRVVVEPSAGPLDVGRAHRLVTLPQRRALEARDGGCVIPGCGAAPAHCDAHHVRPWTAGGPTDLPNLCLLCPGHHTAVHVGSWHVSVEADGLSVTPPRWVDPTRTPRPVHHHRIRRALDDLDDLDDPHDPHVSDDLDRPVDPEPPPADRHPLDVLLRERRGPVVDLGQTPLGWGPGPPVVAARVDLSSGPLVGLLQAVLAEHAPVPP